MSNTYFKILNRSVQNQYTDNIISDVQKDLRNNTCEINANIYDAIQETKRNISSNKDIDINTLLKYYVLNQLIKDSDLKHCKEDSLENSLEETANPNIRYCLKENKYYKSNNGEFVVIENIEEIFNDGSYATIENRRSSSFKIKKYYSNNDKLLSIQLLDSFKNVIDNEWQVAELLGMKKEYINRHKYAGYSGNSSDIVATFLNKISSPIESGCYMDKQCNLYKWSSLKKCFLRSFQVEQKSPLLVDYEFTKNIVIRKEYTGI